MVTGYIPAPNERAADAVVVTLSRHFPPLEPRKGYSTDGRENEAMPIAESPETLVYNTGWRSLCVGAARREITILILISSH